MTQLSKERLEWLTKISGRDDIDDIDGEEIREMARRLLASAAQEPVAWRWFHLNQWHVTNDEGRARDLAWDGVKVMPLYAAPLPVAVPDEIEPSIEAIKNILPTANPDEYAACVGADMWNACRAAALNQTRVKQPSCDEPVSRHYRLPQWIPCSERMPEETGRYWCYVEEQNDLGKSHYQWNCSWNGNRWWVESENGGRVTHWQPLPSAPQEPTK